MIQVIPSILEKTQEAVREKLRKAEGVAEWAHLDVADGRFVVNQTWNDPTELGAVHADVKIEVHLMVERPAAEIERWAPAAARLVAHIEAFSDDEGVEIFLKDARQAHRRVGLALNPETSLRRIVPYLPHLDCVLLMGVHPGFSGQPFVEETVARIGELHREHPEAVIAVDGGVNAERARRMAEAGASILVSGSFVWSHPTLEEGVRALQESARGGETNGPVSV